MNTQIYLKLILTCSMLQGGILLSAQPSASITLRCNELHQTIDGFGVGEADWADDVFVFPQRKEVLDALLLLKDYRLIFLGEKSFLTMQQMSIKQILQRQQIQVCR